MIRSEKDPKRIIKAAMPEEKYGAHSVRPCKGGGILVEGTFDEPFSMEILCRILRDTGKCAEKLGVARLFYAGCGVTLYRNGRVDVHRVQSTEEAIEILDEVKVIVREAFVQGDESSILVASRVSLTILQRRRPGPPVISAIVPQDRYAYSDELRR